jgi:hypothetical protein
MMMAAKPKQWQSEIQINRIERIERKDPEA